MHIKVVVILRRDVLGTRSTPPETSIAVDGHVRGQVERHAIDCSSTPSAAARPDRRPRSTGRYDRLLWGNGSTRASTCDILRTPARLHCC